MLNIEGVNFNDLYTLKDIEDFALVADPSLFEFMFLREEEDWPYQSTPVDLISPFTADELQDLIKMDSYSAIITSGSLVNNKLKRLQYHLQDINPNSIVEDVHLYVCKGDNPLLFGIHHDKPHNLIIQVDGETEWTLYKEHGTLDPTTALKGQKLRRELKKTLKPGEHLFIPSRKYHLPLSTKPRLSASVLYR
jgi:ribosomal protein L16 Arg81 hydroxylase